MKKLMLFPALALTLALVALPALAQAVAGATTVVDLGWLVDDALELVALVVVSVVLPWAAVKVRKWSNGLIDLQQNALLDKVLAGAIAYARRELGERATFETQSTIIKGAADLAEKNGPGVLRHFGLTRDRLEKLIVARMGGAAS